MAQPNSNANNCKTSCCVFNYYTKTVYNPNPPRLWSRFGYVCPCYPTNPCLQSLSSWTQSNKPNDNFGCLSSGDDCIKAIAGGGIFAGIGIWYSTNGGINWSQSSISFGSILSLSSSSNGNIAIAGIFGLGLWYSVNGGQSWLQSNEGLPKSFSFISISGDGTRAIAGSTPSGKKIWYSADGGANWQQSLLSSSANYANCEFISVSINSNATKAVAVGKDSSDSSLWYSTDGGTNWTISLTVPNFIGNGSFTFVVISRDGTKAIAGGDAGSSPSSIGLYYSINGGQNWLPSTLTPIIPSIIFNSASISTNGLKMVASSNTGIWYSSDGGVTWNQGYSGVNVDKVVISGDGKNAVAGGSVGSFGLLYSIDSGKTWTQTSKTNNNFPSIVINNDGTKAIAANLDNGEGLWYSECSEQIIPCSTDFDLLNERRKAEILKYKANSSNVTKKQQYANAASNRWLTGRKRSWATQTDTYTNPNTSALQRVGNVLVCNNNNVRCTLTSGADVPGKVQPLCYDPTVPLYNYKVTRTYNGGGGKYGLYGRVQVVSLSNFPNLTKTYQTDTTFDLTPPTSNSPGAFTYTSSNPLVATISGITVTIVGMGTCIITATQAAYSNYTSGSISALLSVKATPSLSHFQNLTKTYQTDTTFDLTPPTSNSPGAFTYMSTNPLVATIVGNIVTIQGASVQSSNGVCTIIATQAPTANYTSASISASLTVNKYQTILSPLTIPPPNTKTYGDHDNQFQLTATSDRTFDSTPITYSSDNHLVATVDNTGLVTIVAAGSCTFTAKQAATNNYLEGTVTTVPPLVVNGKTSTVYDWNSLAIGQSRTFTTTSALILGTGAIITIAYSDDTDFIIGNIISVVGTTVTIKITGLQFASDTYTPRPLITGAPAPIGIAGSEVSPVLNFFPATTNPSNGIIPTNTIITTGVVYIYNALPSTLTFTMRINGTGVVDRADADAVMTPAYSGGVPAPTSVTWQGANGGCFVAGSQAPVIQAVTIATGRVNYGYPNGAPLAPPYFAGVIKGYQVPYSSGIIKIQ